MHIPVPESTSEQPLLFFERFYESDIIIAKVKKSFFPDSEDPEDPNYPYLINIDGEKESYTINFPTIESVYNDNDELIEIIERSEVKTYKFEDELYKELKREFFKSRILLDEIINNSISTNGTKLKIKIWLGVLAGWNSSILQMEGFKRYNEIIRPVHALIRHVYKNYKVISPRPPKDFNSILEGISPKQKTFEDEISLSKLFFKTVVSLVDKQGVSIIEFRVGPQETEKMKYANILEEIYSGKYPNIESPINFLWGQEPVCYLFSMFQEYGSRLAFTKLEKSKIIKVKNVSFKADNAYKYNFTLRKKNTFEKSLINELFNKHVKW